MKPIHKYLFYLLILLLPTQLGRHFWPSWSFVNGLRLDYLSPTLYLTDIIIIGVLLSWLLPKFKFVKIHTYLISGRWSFKHVFFIFLFLTLNVLLARNQTVAFFKLLKLLELFLLTLYIKKNIAISPARRSPRLAEAFGEAQVGEGGQYRNIVFLFSLTILYSSLLAWFQFIKQSSLGGIFWFLGERTFTVTTPGIATAILNGKMLLRPYATFPHPNVLAGYLTVLLPFLLFLPRSTDAPLGRLYKFPLFALTLSTILITFSRSAWVTATLILFAALLYYKSKRVGYFISDRLSSNPLFFSIILLFIILLSPLLLSRFRSLTTTDTQSLKLRRELNQTAISMIKNHPLTGVGLNNFLLQLPNYRPIKTFQDLQPAHNIYLLIAAETGVAGLGIFFFLIFKACRKLISKSEFLISKQAPNPIRQLADQIPKKKLGLGSLGIGNYLGQLEIRSIRNLTLLLSLTSLLLLGLADHYFFTLQQTQLLLAIILGFIFAGKKA